jgi:hypothetical protein
MSDSKDHAFECLGIWQRKKSRKRLERDYIFIGAVVVVVVVLSHHHHPTHETAMFVSKFSSPIKSQKEKIKVNLSSFAKIERASEGVRKEEEKLQEFDDASSLLCCASQVTFDRQNRKLQMLNNLMN